MTGLEIFTAYVMPFLAAMLGAGVGASVALLLHRGEMALQRRTVLAQAIGPVISDLYELSRHSASELRADMKTRKAALAKFNEHALVVIMHVSDDDYDQTLRQFDEAGQQLMWWTTSRVSKDEKNAYIHALTTALRGRDPTLLPRRLEQLHRRFDGSAKWRKETGAANPLTANYPEALEETRKASAAGRLKVSLRARRSP